MRFYNTKKLERKQFRALRFVFLDFESDYETLLDRAGLPTLELSRKKAILIAHKYNASVTVVYFGRILSDHRQKYRDTN